MRSLLPLLAAFSLVSAADAPALAARMLGGTLVTKQTGPAGKPVNTLLVARKMARAREMYLAILLDRKAAGPVVVREHTTALLLQVQAQRVKETTVAQG